MPLGINPGVVSVKSELADPLADKVLRLFDAAVSIDVDGTVPERADGEDGNCQKRRATLLVESAKEVGHAQFGDVVGAPTYHRFEDLWDNPSAVEGYVRALDLD